jgi:predicted small secreted protein
MDRTLALMMVAALAFTLTACGDEEGTGEVIPTVDTGQQDAGQDVGVDADEPDVGPDAAEDTGPDAEEDMGMDAGPPPIDLTGTWLVARTSDAVEVATLSLTQDEQFVDGTVMMGEEYDSAVGVLGTVLIDDTDRTVSLTWIVDDTENHRLLESEFSDEMTTQYSSPDGFNIEVTVTRQ